METNHHKGIDTTQTTNMVTQHFPNIYARVENALKQEEQHIKGQYNQAEGRLVVIRRKGDRRT